MVGKQTTSGQLAKLAAYEMCPMIGWHIISWHCPISRADFVTHVTTEQQINSPIYCGCELQLQAHVILVPGSGESFGVELWRAPK